MNLPVVTDADRARGWAELEVEFLDGSRQFVRVHALDQAELICLGNVSPAGLQTECLAKSLRVDKSFIARLHESSFFAALAVMVSLLHGDVAAAAIARHAAISVLESNPQSVPLTAPSALAEFMALSQGFREQLALMPKLPELPQRSTELRQLPAIPA